MGPLQIQQISFFFAPISFSFSFSTCQVVLAINGTEMKEKLAAVFSSMSSITIFFLYIFIYFRLSQALFSPYLSNSFLNIKNTFSSFYGCFFTGFFKRAIPIRIIYRLGFNHVHSNRQSPFHSIFFLHEHESYLELLKFLV